MFGDDDCTESGKTDVRLCNTHLLPCDHIWEEWGQLGQCPVTCGSGNQRRHRTCKNIKTNSKVQKGVENKCEGSPFEDLSCKEIGECPIWADWNQWSNCPVTCLAAR